MVGATGASGMRCVRRVRWIAATAPLVACSALLAACSPGSASPDGSTSPTSAAPTASGATTSSPPPSVTSTQVTVERPQRTTTTSAPRPTVPAGVQFRPPSDLPAGFEAGGGDVAGDGGTTTVVMGTQTDAVGGTSAAAAVSEDGVSWEVVALPAPVGFSVAGYTALRFSADEVAHGPLGYVAAGASSGLRDGSVYATGVDVLWHSLDGTTWQFVDVRPAVDGEAEAIDVADVEWIGDRYLAVGAVAGADLFAGPSRGLVLASPDGVTWSEASRIASTWSTRITDIARVGATALLRGAEYACAADARALATFSPGAQLRLWTTTDGGVSVAPVSLPAGVADSREPAPVDTAGCPSADEANRLQAIEQRFATNEAAVVANATHAVVVAGDRSIAAASSDLATWQTAPLPGARPAATEATTPPRGSFALARDGADLVLVAAGPPRNARDEVTLPSGAMQTIAWRLDPSGGWTREPAGRPQLVHGFPTLHPVGDDVVLVQRGAASERIRARVWRSSRGELNSWGACVPAPNANCAFADLTETKAGGLDLTDINLVGVSGKGVDLTGARLVGADLRLANLPGVGLRGANLTGADLRDASLVGAELSSALLDAADLSRARLDGSFFLAQSTVGTTMTGATILLGPDEMLEELDLAGRDLSAVAILAEGAAPVPMHDADFTAANLIGARFVGIDLTGAVFAAARMESVSFVDVVCPDGGPPDASVFGAAACRL